MNKKNKNRIERETKDNDGNLSNRFIKKILDRVMIQKIRLLPRPHGHLLISFFALCRRHCLSLSLSPSGQVLSVSKLVIFRSKDKHFWYLDQTYSVKIINIISNFEIFRPWCQIRHRMLSLKNRARAWTFQAQLDSLSSMGSVKCIKKILYLEWRCNTDDRTFV